MTDPGAYSNIGCVEIVGGPFGGLRQFERTLLVSVDVGGGNRRRILRGIETARSWPQTAFQGGKPSGNRRRTLRGIETSLCHPNR